MIVTGALSSPSDISGSGPGAIRSAGAWAKAGTKAGTANPATAKPPTARPPLEAPKENSRRVIFTAGSLILCVFTARFHRCAQACQRGTQRFVGNVRKRCRYGGLRLHVNFGHGPDLAPAQWGLTKANRAHGLPAEELVDALQQHPRHMLDFDRGGSFHPQHQRAGLWHIFAKWSWPLDFFRLRVCR